MLRQHMRKPNVETHPTTYTEKILSADSAMAILEDYANRNVLGFTFIVQPKATDAYATTSARDCLKIVRYKNLRPGDMILISGVKSKGDKEARMLRLSIR
jgi:hypothetical protein